MNKYLSFIFASVLTLTGVQLSKASNPSDSLAIVSAKWERTSSLQGIQLKQASIEGLFGGKQSISILTIGRAEGYTAFIATTDSLTTTSQLAANIFTPSPLFASGRVFISTSLKIFEKSFIRW